MSDYPESLEKSPEKLLEYYWADYIELLCLANPDKMISKSDFVNRVKNRSNDFNDPLADDIQIDLDFYKDGPFQEEDADLSINDKWSNRTNDYFRFLIGRVNNFGESYPFEVSSDKKIFSLKTNFSDSQKLYIFFLFSSNLKYFSPKMTSIFTGSFEKICVEATKSYLVGWDVHSFGVGAEVHSKYEGKLWKKITSLSEDLCGKLICDEKDFPSNNRGDGGLDIVAWKKFNDSQDGFPIIFGQCACTKEWNIKQHSSNHERWGERIKTKSRPLNIIYVPICFRDASGQWYKKDEISNSILLDRLRLNEIVTNIESFQTSNSYEVVDNLISLEESCI